MKCRASARRWVRDIIWSVGADNLAALVDRIRDHLDATGRATGRVLLLDDQDLPALLDLPLPPVVRQHTYLVFRVVVTNALKYSRPASDIVVVLRYATDLEMSVTTQSEAAVNSRAGQGMRNMRHCAQLMHAELTAGPVSDGWQVWLRVPA